jgi:hypothetical protein
VEEQKPEEVDWGCVESDSVASHECICLAAVGRVVELKRRVSHTDIQVMCLKIDVLPILSRVEEE